MLNTIFFLILVSFNLLLINFNFGFNKNLIIIIISLELLLFANSLFFIYISFLLDDSIGLIFSIIILILAGCESALSLAIIVKYYNYKKTIDIV